MFIIYVQSVPYGFFDLHETNGRRVPSLPRPSFPGDAARSSARDEHPGLTLEAAWIHQLGQIPLPLALTFKAERTGLLAPIIHPDFIL